MRSKILFLFFGVVVANGAQNIELLADDVKREGEIVTANKNVIVYSQDYFMSADRAIYNQQDGTLELFDNVNVMRGKDDISRCSYAKINLNNKDSEYETTFMMNKDIEVWIQSDTSSSDSQFYITSNSIVSSCNVQDPDWKIKFSSGNLNKESKFLHLYNPVFYIADVPVFYLPYFGFSTDTTRRSGLLQPEIAYSKGDGLYYRQPIYIAEYNEWDVQFDPQIRTNRGAGLYGKLRFVDSPYSSGKIGFGAFNDSESYRQRQKERNSNRLPLKNKTHKGVDIKYERDRLVKHLIDGDLQEGFLLDATNLNDIDYINLKNRSERSDEDSLVISKLNYFLSSYDHYFATYARYYIDTAKIGDVNENKSTLQEYPSFQYHKFVSNTFLPNLLYSFDVTTRNYTRKIGVEATRYDFSLPIALHVPIGDDYLKFSYYNNTYSSFVDYKNKIYRPTGNEDKSGSYLENSNQFSLHTDMSKAYESFFHSVNFAVDYTIRGFNQGALIDNRTALDNGYVYDMNANAYENFITSQITKNELATRATQYFFNQSGRKFLRHTILQGYYTKDAEYSNLKNITQWYPLPNLSLYNKIEYSHKYRYIDKIQNGITYSNSLFSTNILHAMWRSDDTSKSDYLQANLGVNLTRDYKIFGGIQYNLEDTYTRQWKAGLTHKRKCWNYSLLYAQEIEPTTTSNGAAVKRTHGVYFMINFYPMGGLHYDFSVTKDPTAKNSD
ncbi:MAG: LPS-assembly protein LptD [Campylobacter sp.]